jgi:hypothetical protein
MLYGHIKLQPNDKLNFYVSLMGGSYDGQKGYDVTLGADYIFSNNVGLGVGYREFQTEQSSELDDFGSDIELDLKVGGGFLRVFYQQ